MQNIETNPFICFLPDTPRILILGSFPCDNGSGYGNWYYSGSGKNHFWDLLSDLFEMPAGTRDEKETLCQANGIALSDIAYRIRRKLGNCSDTNLQIIEFNLTGIQQCLSTPVQAVFCTSRFVLNHFIRLFPANTLPVTQLISPSPAANRHIGGLSEYKHLLKKKVVLTPYDYRLVKYRELMGELLRKSQ